MFKLISDLVQKAGPNRLALLMLAGLTACTLGEIAPTSSPAEEILPTPSPTEDIDGNLTVTVTVYFLDSNRYATAEEPYEVGVTREAPAGQFLPEVVLEELFLGPTPDEQAQGLMTVYSGSTGFRSLVVQDGVAHVYLDGQCNSGGATYTIASLLAVNLKQFDTIEYVKVYDENGETEITDGLSDSIPFCLEP
jgi:hypothetical protein